MMGSEGIYIGLEGGKAEGVILSGTSLIDFERKKSTIVMN
jgi:hypothetical protein